MKRFLAVLAVLLGFAGPALAAQTVELRSDIAIHDGRVTLGDLFDGAGGVSGVLVASGSGNLVLDAARLQALAGANGLSWANAQGLRRVIARADAAPAGAPAGAVAQRQASVLVYARDIQTGEVVQPEDLMWSKTPAFGVPFDAPRDSKTIIGQAARRPLREGAAAATKDVSPPQVVKKDDVVAIAYEAGGIRLVLQAKALKGAALGEVFDAINPGSKKVIQAVASGSDEGVVGPEADRIKAAIRTDPQLFASLH